MATGDAPEKGAAPAREDDSTAALEPVEYAAAAESGAVLVPGAYVGRYVVLGLLGQGGMGVVYDAYDPELHRKVAIKLLQADDTSEGKRAEQRLRLLREAQALAQLSHPNVIAVYDVGTFGEKVFMAMERVEGKTLRAWNTEPHGWREVVRVFESIGAGVQAAHARGLVHRDLKPDNVLIDLEGRARVLDFGLARAAHGSSLSEEPSSSAMGSSEVSGPYPVSGSGSHPILDMPLTLAGHVIGTPAYMAPELMQGLPADSRSDQFSFCVAFHESLFGERPYSREVRAGSQPWPSPVPPKSAQVPTWLARTVARGLRFEPQERYASMSTLLTHLSRADPARWRTRATVALVGGIAIAAALSVGRFSGRTNPCEGAAGEMAAVMEPVRMAALEHAFDATHLPYAHDSFERVREALTTYGDAWTALATQVCRATRVSRSQPEEVFALRMGCLERRREELESLVQALSLPDTGLADVGPKAVTALTPLAGCNNVEALRAPLGRPADATGRAREKVLRAQYAEGKAKLDTAHYPEGLALATSVVSGARELHDLPLEAEGLELRGTFEERLGRIPQADDSFEAGVNAAEAGNHRRLVALNAARRTRIKMIRSQFDASRELARFGRAALAGAGGDLLISATLDMAEGAVEFRHGAPSAAFAFFQAALATRLQALGPDHPDVAGARNNVGAALSVLGRTAEATAQMQLALASYEHVLGSRHPETTNAQQNLAVILHSVERLPEAQALFDQALPSLEAQLGAENSHLSQVLDVGSRIYRDLNRPEVAAVLAERAVRLLEKDGKDVNGADLADRLANLSDSQLKLGRVGPAEASLRRALSVSLAALKTDPKLEATTVRMYAALATFLTHHGTRAEAMDLVRRAELGLKHSGTWNADDANGVISELGLAFEALGDTGRALGLAEQHLAGREKLSGVSSPENLAALTQLGSAQLHAKKAALAQATFERALTLALAHRAWPGTTGPLRLYLARALPPGAASRARVTALLTSAQSDLETAQDRTALVELAAFKKGVQ